VEIRSSQTFSKEFDASAKERLSSTNDMDLMNAAVQHNNELPTKSLYSASLTPNNDKNN